MTLTIDGLALAARNACDDAVARLEIERRFRIEYAFESPTAPEYLRTSSIALAMVDARLRWLGWLGVIP